MWPFTKKLDNKKTLEQAMNELLRDEHFGERCIMSVSFLHDVEYKYINDTNSALKDLCLSRELYSLVSEIYDHRKNLVKRIAEEKKPKVEPQQKVEPHPNERKIIF